MIFGLDANTYKVHNDQYQGVENFQENIAAMGMGSCWGDRPNPNSSTTCNARTYLQPQLNKAVGLKEKIEKADKNLKVSRPHALNPNSCTPRPRTPEP